MVFFEAGEGEHPDLASDMGPVVGGAELLEVGNQAGPHRADPGGHRLDFSKPLVVEFWGVQDSVSDSCTMERWV